ncbi:ABC transporter ATP-binding protein [Halochromatium sp.]
MAALTLSGLQPRILAPVDLHIDAGELLFISGPSGSGKSLLLRAIADLDPNQGEVLLDDQPRSRIQAPQWRQRVGLLPAESGWWADRVGPHFAASAATASVGPAAGEGADPKTASASAQAEHRRAEGRPLLDLLGQLGFGADVLDWDVQRLSTGERQRLALARLLHNRPQALLLDEATANLDPTNRQQAEHVIETYRRTERAAVLWVSHDPDQRRRLARAAGGRCVVIDSGRLIPEQPDPPRESAEVSRAWT